MLTKRSLLTKVRFPIGLVAAVVAAAALAGHAWAGSGLYYPASVSCRSDSQTLVMTANADALPGYSVQWIAAQFYFRNLDTNTGWYAPSYSSWSYFQNQFSETWYGTNSKLGSTTLQYTVPRGHYEVFVQYLWWNGSRWTNSTGWIRTSSYHFTWVMNGVPFDEAPTTCPVGLYGR